MFTQRWDPDVSGRGPGDSSERVPQGGNLGRLQLGDIPSPRPPQCLRFARSLLATSMQMLGVGASRICFFSIARSREFVVRRA
jgi:hypothetical protein